MPDDMRGLHNFIAEIRATKSKEAEEKRINKELANIRSKFKGDKPLDGYQKKKYVCKLLFMFLLGEDIDFGHMEAISLVASNKYSEKQIGYLFLSVMINETSDFNRLIIQQIKNDLLDRNETHVCLALTCIANVGGREMAESLAGDVQKLLVSPDSRSFVKKKAALTLLRLYRKFPEILPVGEYTPRIIALLDDPDLSVVTSVLALLYALVQADTQGYGSCVDRAIARLRRLQTREESLEGYVYYDIAAPWLQVKLLRFLQVFPAPAPDSRAREAVVEVLRSIVGKAANEPVRDKRNKQQLPQYFNARNAVLYEAVRVLIHLESETDLLVESSNLLGRFLSSKETNLRYFALELMSSLATLSFTHEAIKRHQETVVNALTQEKDISVRRRALDLLYNLCGKSNVRVIVRELLQYLQVADYEIREEMVLKIAVLAELHADDYSWYVDVILQLIRVAGDYVSEEVWHRVVQIVTNQPDVQDYATKVVFDALCSPYCHETMVKVGGYLLGEFGHLIANNPRATPQIQLQLLLSKFSMCSPSTRALLLSTLVKFANLFPEIKTDIETIFRSNNLSRNTDPEIQQRVIEYLSLSQHPNPNVMPTVLEEMPKFKERESSLLAKIREKSEGVSVDAEAAKVARQTVIVDRDRQEREDREEREARRSNPAVSQQPQANLLGDLDAAPASTGPSAVNTTSQPPQANPELAHLSRAFLFQNDGKLYEDAILQIGVKTSVKNNLARVALYFGNKSGYPITNFTSDVFAINTTETLSLQAKPVEGQLAPKAQTQQLINVECLKEFEEQPTLGVAYVVNGQLQRAVIKFPIFVNKFLASFDMDQPTFVARWKQLSAPGLESQKVFKAAQPIDVAAVRSKLQSMGFTVLAGVDPNPDNFVCAGVVHTGSSQVGVLLRLEPNRDAQMYRATFRTSRDTVSRILCDLVASSF
ncbi:adaptin [Capsaspora owczarzaki ATCC 30864]|uniref:AP-2 complex subunit alpha n=1 Tax=Capsaspora owczarzaki (strain ATCC 30864) TaxID=595528 RepID=A0A0D2X3R4_CAPO3|nr:adaptin [Capsaspora owczarzaki ATCC 30864]KJE94764.1 adaptin [Capsaspora owczarzaki ATCC 30864]|eukprot:XP_004347037.1 adaptin [Capsaspora owczarzaki ATCC 30864]